VSQWREHVALIYVDVVEFDGTHIRKFYEDMANRFDTFLKSHHIAPQLADGLSPTSAVMLATRIFFNYFSVEIIFGVKDHFGKQTDQVIAEVSRILRHGMLKRSVIPSVARDLGGRAVRKRRPSRRPSARAPR